MPILLPLLLALPVVAAIVVAALGPRRGDAVRWISLGSALVGLVLAGLLAFNFVAIRQAKQESPGATVGDATIPTFSPELRTRIDLLRLPGLNEPPDPDKTVRQTAIRFDVGIDGLNIWLIVLTALLMVSAVLISWTAIQNRVNEYYAWLLALGSTMIGVFAAFDLIVFYSFFELTLVPLFFLIGIWGGPQRQYAARKFFIYTLAGSLITLLGVLGIVLACYLRNGVMTFSIPQLVELVNSRLGMEAAAEREFWRRVQ